MIFIINFQFRTQKCALRGSQTYWPPRISFLALEVWRLNFFGIFFFVGHFYENSHCLPVPESFQLQLWVILYQLSVEQALTQAGRVINNSTRSIRGTERARLLSMPPSSSCFKVSIQNKSKTCTACLLFTWLQHSANITQGSTHSLL